MAIKILPDRGVIKDRHPYLLQSGISRNRDYRSGGFSAISEATILKTLTAKE